jgi:hypothetical protein
MQACGVGRAEHKRILIPPVLVRTDLFTGSPSEAGVTYKV